MGGIVGCCGCWGRGLSRGRGFVHDFTGIGVEALKMIDKKKLNKKTLFFLGLASGVALTRISEYGLGILLFLIIPTFLVAVWLQKRGGGK